MKHFLNSVVTHPFQSAIYVLVVGLTVGLLASPYYMFAIAPGLGLLAFVLMGVYPRFWYYLVVFLVPFGAFRGPGGSFSFVKIHWLISFVLLVVVLLAHLRRKVIENALRSNLWPLMGLLLLSFVISGSFASYPQTVVINLGYLLVAYLFFALGLLFITPGGLRGVLPGVLIWSISLGSVLAILGSFFQVPFFAEQVGQGAYGRATGGSTDPNHLAMIICFAIPLVVHWVFHARTRLGKLIGVVLLVVNMMGMVTTFSRGGAMVLALVFLGLFVQYARRLRPRQLGLVVAGIALVLVMIPVFVPQDYWDRQRTVADPLDMSMSRRKSYIVFGWESFIQNPVLGTGPGTFPDLYARSGYARKYAARSADPLDLRRMAHNTYIDVVVGNGMIGLAIFLAILIKGLRAFSEAKRNAIENGDDELALTIQAYRLSFVSLLLFLLIHSNLYNKYLLIILAVSQVALRASQVESDTSDDEAVAPA